MSKVSWFAPNLCAEAKSRTARRRSHSSTCPAEGQELDEQTGHCVPIESSAAEQPEAAEEEQQQSEEGDGSSSSEDDSDNNDN